MVKLFHHVLFSRVLERVNDQEMRDGKSVDTIRDSRYHKEIRVQKRRGKGGGQHTRQTLEKSPTSKLYTTWAHILSDRNKFAPRGEGENGGVQCPRGFSCFFFGGHLSQTSGFCSAKEILIVSFATQPRAFILSDRNIFYIPGGRTMAGLMPLGLFLFLFFGGHLPQTPSFCSAKETLVANFR